ncbi:helix-turn-helix transcriptional regulator [Brevundimonas nasdae]|uniref:helix-turn-helix transcriptional regulator n=1 Tax=Brevundimonas TaxID=41275 RepID=UPI003C6CFA5C
MAHREGLERFLGWRQVKALTGLGRTTAWRMRQAGDFPDPVPISPGRVAWRERDIAAWNESRGAAVAQRPSLAARIPPRRDQERKAPTTVTPRPPLTDAPTPVQRAKTSPRKRKPIAVAEGQLGFDFYDNRL